MAQKITEFCNRVAYVEVTSYEGWSSYDECHTVDIECITTEGNIISTSFDKSRDVNAAIECFVEMFFPCDRYFFTGKKIETSNKFTRQGGYYKNVYTFYLHTVTVL